MRSENLFLKMHPHLSNKLLSWKPSKVGEGCQTSFSNHIWHGIKCLPGFSGHEALKKTNVQVESLTKRKLGLRSNHSCPSGLRLLLLLFLNPLERDRPYFSPLATTYGITKSARSSAVSQSKLLFESKIPSVLQRLTQMVKSKTEYLMPKFLKVKNKTKKWLSICGLSSNLDKNI